MLFSTTKTFTMCVRAPTQSQTTKLKYPLLSTHQTWAVAYMIQIPGLMQTHGNLSNSLVIPQLVIPPLMSSGAQSKYAGYLQIKSFHFL